MGSLSHIPKRESDDKFQILNFGEYEIVVNMVSEVSV